MIERLKKKTKLKDTTEQELLEKALKGQKTIYGETPERWAKKEAGDRRAIGVVYKQSVAGYTEAKAHETILRKQGWVKQEVAGHEVLFYDPKEVADKG